MKTSFRVVIFLYAALFFLFIFSTYAIAVDNDIVITEIGAYEKSDHEWIEIYNNGAAPVDLTGWKFFENNTNHGLSAYRGDFIIEPGEYAVVADNATNTTNDYLNFTGTLIDSSWETLNESGEAIALKDKNGVVIEQFTYITAPDFSLERKNLLTRDYSSANWNQHASGNTIGAQNSNATEQQQQQVLPPADMPSSTPSVDQEQLNSQKSIPPPWIPVRGDILINEFIADPSDEQPEWIELYNVTNRIISLDGWSIEDGSKSPTILHGTLSDAGAGKFFVIENPKGILNNSGDRIVLFNQNHEAIDDISYGSYNDGNISNNAPRAYNPDSVARRGDGKNTYNNSIDFQITTTPTKGTANIITVKTVDEEDKKEISMVKDIQITELLPNPAISEGQDEFIELFNEGKIDVNLAGWFLISESGQRYVISKNDSATTTIRSGEFFVVYRKVSNIALKNIGGDSIKLYQPNSDRASALFTYHEKAPIGQSCMKQNARIIWTQTPTPGAKNIFTTSNQPPDVEVLFPSKGNVGEELIFDSSDTFDREHDPLIFQWDFGDGQKAQGDYVHHVFQKIGEFTVILNVSDGQHEEKSTRHIRISQKEQPVQQNFSIVPEKINEVGKKNIPSGVIVEQVYPNPTGRDTEEFVSLKNMSTTPIDISGWNIQTEKYAKPFTLPLESMLLPQKSISLQQEKSGLRLQNTSDAVYLFTSEGSLADSVDYEDAPEGRVLMRAKDGVWKWMKPSGIQNTKETVIVTQNSKKKSKKIKTSVRAASYKNTLQENAKETPVGRIRTLESGSNVRFSAVVSVEPGILGKTLFYVAGSGIQVYNSRKDFPDIHVGDTIDVFGILQESGSEMRVRITGKSAVRVLAHGKSPEPEALETSAIGEETEGYLARIQGEVIETRWPYMFLDDGGGEVRVYIKKSTGIEKRKLYVGDELSVIGIVSQTPAGYRILPRYESDIVLIKNPEKEQKQEEAMPDRTKETKTLFQYLVAIGITATLVSLGLFIQYRMKE